MSSQTDSLSTVSEAPATARPQLVPEKGTEKPIPAPDLDLLCINTIRFLSVDAVEQAHSGHPGLPLGAAPMGYVLWDRFLRHNPHNPKWFNRDRFVLSAGHGSMLLYSLLNLTGYDLPLSQIERFRQWGSETPGHPEAGETPGIEVTTGPLGQGFGMGVGMAIAEAHLAAVFNRPGFSLVDHYTYGIVSDGDLMEGVASEAASLAGTLQLGKLIYLYDNNHVTLEGPAPVAFTEDVGRRFTAYGWHVQKVTNGNNLEAIDAAIRAAQANKEQPSLIMVQTHIGYGSPKQDTYEAHGEPLGPEATRKTKKKLHWPLEPTFLVPDEARAHMAEAIERGAQLESQWNDLLGRYRSQFASDAVQLERMIGGQMPQDWTADLPWFAPDPAGLATRAASGKVMNAIAKRVPELMGGSADLNPSTKTYLAGFGDFHPSSHDGRNVHFGVREHAMGAIVNGMAMHGALIPFGATFFCFTDYMRPAVRIAALMKSRSIFVYTHDSIGLGEDGPTHEPVEHLTSLRAMPDMTVLRPADANETTVAWRLAIERRRPVCLVLTRQNLPIMDVNKYPIRDGVPHGGYVLADAQGHADVIIIATGSEVQLALAARDKLAERKVSARVVSMPSCELFEEQTAEYRQQVLPADVPKLAVEAGATLGWYKYVGEKGAVIGVDRFGASAPGKIVMEKLGLNVDNVVEHALRLVGKQA
jgi:transketolase